MIGPAQIRADFDKLRSTDHEHGEIVALGFGGKIIRALKSAKTRSVTLHEYGEEEGDLFSVRFLVTDFDVIPHDKDVVTIDGEEYQVGEVRLSGFNQIARAFIMDVDS